MLKRHKILICSFLVILLGGCAVHQGTPSANPTPTRPQSTAEEGLSGPAVMPSETAAGNSAALQKTGTPIDILAEAVKNLVNAKSFEMTANEVISYQGLGAEGNTTLVYGEFLSNYAVIQHPLLKVTGHHAYRFVPGMEYSSYESFLYQQGDRYFSHLVEPSGASTPTEVEPHSVPPFSIDVYQALIQYSDQARLVSETDQTAVYILEHPKWYTLESAIGFADLGFLSGQENSEELIEQYVAEHYQDVESVEFRIFVAVDEYLISKVEVDNRAFMHSVWNAVNTELLEQGAEIQSLTQYDIRDDHKAEYLFIHYNQVEDFQLTF